MALPPEKLTRIKELIRDGEKRLKELEPEIEKARRAGIDVTERVKKARELKVRIDKLRTVYF